MKCILPLMKLQLFREASFGDQGGDRLECGCGYRRGDR